MTGTETAAQGRRSRTGIFLVVGLLLALVLAGVVSYYASSSPDGLNKVAADQGLDANAQDHAMSSGPLAGYGVQGVDNDRLSVGIAGVIGVAVTFAFAGGLFLLVRKRRPDSDA